MRYRAIGPAGAIVSCLSLSLAGDPGRTRPGDWVAFIYAGLENGINGFDVRQPDLALADGLKEAFAGVDRQLAFVCWRLGLQPAGQGGGRDFSAKAMTDQVRAALARTGLQYLDGVLLDDPGEGEPPPDALEALGALKSAGLVRFVGVAGESDAIDGHITSGAFDLLSTPFNLTSGWRERHRLRAAGSSDMAVIGYRFAPDGVRKTAAAAASAKPPVEQPDNWRNPLSGRGSYAFLEQTQGWQADEICLAYALTEPALASVQIRPASIGEMERLAAVVDRDMPPGLAAQIEMARFAPQAEAQDLARTKRRA
jgi:aryl-alcohol dehydrogenase-like predicted oxidoreductase